MENKEVVVYKGSVGAWINGLMLGMLVGAVTALLYTPRSGPENREMLGEKTSQIRERAIEIVDDTRSRASHVIERARGQLERGSEMMREHNKELREENRIMEDQMRKTYDL